MTRILESAFLALTNCGARLTRLVFVLVLRGYGASKEDAAMRGDDYEKWFLLGVNVGVGVGTGLYSGARVETVINPVAWETNPATVTQITGVQPPSHSAMQATLSPAGFGRASVQVH